MRILTTFFTFLMLLVISPYVYAVEVNSIYQASIPVISQADDVRSAGVKKALEQVLIEVSGNSHILDTSTKLKASVAHADDLVQQFSYSMPPQPSSTEPFILIVRFDPEDVNKLLRDAGTASWGQNRPLILVWLAYEAPNHPAEIIDSSENTIQTLLKTSAKQRGLPLIFPVMDASEVGQISAGNIVNKTLDPLKQASLRYASNAILIGHLSQAAETARGQWQLILGPDQWTWDISGKDSADVFSQLVNNISDTLASRYSAVVTNTVQSHMSLKVLGLSQQADISQLIKYLQQLPPVADVQLQSVAGDAIILNVNLRGSENSFVQAASLGNNLEPIANGNPQDGVLQYKWKP